MSLERFFRPRGVVLVGASENSPWSQLIHGNFSKLGYRGDVYLVNRRGMPAHGRDAQTSCVNLPGIPDLAYIFVPTDAVPEALADVAAAGIPNAMLLSSGYAETGEDGEAAQAALVQKACECGVRLLGPNSLGFINFADSIPVTPFPLPQAPLTGSVAIVSQSGATTQVIAAFADQQGIGLSYAIATGNEADVDTAEIVRFLVDDAATKVITVFAETIKDPASFRIAAQACAAAGKPLIVLKVGRTELAQQLAQAHTGSVAGDDRVFDAVCEQDNVIRVHSLEEMIITAGLLAHTGPIEDGAAILSISGGACEVIADAGEVHGLSLPPFAEPTLAALREVVSAYGATFNPLDVTGAAVRDPALWERLLAIVARDPGIGAIGCVYDMPRGPDDQVNQLALRHIGAGLAATGKPAFVINQALRPVLAEARAMLTELGVPAVIGGLDLAVRALASAQLWSRRRSVAGRSEVTVTQAAVRPTSERGALDFLQEQGVDTPSRVCVLSAGEAVAAWRTMGGPIVLKIASSAIKHKSDIGGVRLNLNDEDAIAEAFDGIMAAAKTAYPQADIDGCLVMPMRGKGVELFVGTARTAWGPAIVVGLGGIWIEALDDVALRLLPVDHQDVMAMLDSLRGRKLLDGYRGQAPVNRDAIATQVVRIGNAALALGPDLVSLEVNPLLALGDTAEALDALAVWDERD
jgi:acyl-CoA synthetase (NDP forming)